MMTTETLAPAVAVAPILELRGVEKQYGAVRALKPLTLSFMPGEVHAIVGENGAGKSTLIKVLTGVVKKTSGSMFWQGGEVSLESPADAISIGINAVHQEVILCRHLTVAANIFLGDEVLKGGFLRKKEMVTRAQAILNDIGFDIPAGAQLDSLTIGQQQLVATARASLRGTKFLIFDEPTAYLTRQEADQLFKLIRRLKAEGVTIVYISHRMEEIFELADRVSVLRDGNFVGTRNIGDTNNAELVTLMINRSLEQIYHKEKVPFGNEVLSTRALTGKGFENIDLSVRQGEIVGLYGLIGAGRSEFAMSLFGRNPSTSGEIRWHGKPIAIRDVRTAIDLGIALAPESRRDQGLNLNLPISLNINLPVYDRIQRGPTLNHREEIDRAERQIRDLAIKTPSRRSLASSMSGGNQQKMVIGKWLNHGAELFIFDEPTVGVDVGTKAEIYRLFGALLKRGAAIIVISSYLPEVYELADTLHVFRTGKQVGTHAYREKTEEEILALAIGV
ncbi:ABC transporter ATP-binding protein [Rhizobium sp. R693]|nr:ABC transporter ATP-binding protein [Rhizobium sp. R693]